MGRRPVLELLRAGRRVERILVVQGSRPGGVLAEISALAEQAGVPVRRVPRARVHQLVGQGNHQGVVALTAGYRYAAFTELLTPAKPALLFLDGVMDPQNLGSLLRTADGAGFHGVVIPAQRSAAVTATVRRVSMGAADVVKVARVSNLSQSLDEAKQAGLWVLGLDEKADDDLWSSPLADPPVALVLGAEDRGMSRPVRNRCDGLARIPYKGHLGSLNVAIAGAVAMFEVARRQHKAGT